MNELIDFNQYTSHKGRTLAIPVQDIIAAGLYKQYYGIATKKQAYELLNPPCSYKTFVVNINRFFPLVLVLLYTLMDMNKRQAHPVKHIDSTTIPVCLFKNAKRHKTMRSLATFGRSSQGTFFGLKLHLVTDLQRMLLALTFTAGNVDDRTPVENLLAGIEGVIIADAGYVSKTLEQSLYQEGKRLFIAKPRKNMKKLMTKLQHCLYDTRMLIELQFRNLKLFHGLVCSLPRSIAGYMANYTYALFAAQLRAAHSH